MKSLMNGGFERAGPGQPARFHTLSGPCSGWLPPGWSSRHLLFGTAGGFADAAGFFRTPMPVLAFAPANGSLIFETYESADGYGPGSLGVGFTLDVGVTATVSRAGAHVIVVGGVEWEFPTVAQVVRELAAGPVRVELQAGLPFGCGFGMSGASALSTALALGALFHPGAGREELALVAHRAEVDHATGRGDVGGQFNGGFMLKARKGAPLEVQRLPIPEQSVYCRIFGPISTRDVLRDAATMQRVNRAGRAALRRVQAIADIDLDALLKLSREFAEESGLLQSVPVRRAIAEAERAGGFASMVMLGEAVVSSVPIPGARAFTVVRNPARVIGTAELGLDLAGRSHRP